MAFDEAMDKYDEERGPFYAFAQLVIRSRALSHLKKMKRAKDEISVEAMEEGGHEFEGRDNIDENMRADIIAWREDLALFGLEFESLIDAAPKHRDTRERAIRISKESSQEKSITDDMFKKFRLPIAKVARLCRVSEKIVRTSKVFITAVIIIFYKKYESLLAWIGGL